MEKERQSSVFWLILPAPTNDSSPRLLLRVSPSTQIQDGMGSREVMGSSQQRPVQCSETSCRPSSAQGHRLLLSVCLIHPSSEAASFLWDTNDSRLPTLSGHTTIWPDCLPALVPVSGTWLGAPFPSLPMGHLLRCFRFFGTGTDRPTLSIRPLSERRR